VVPPKGMDALRNWWPFLSKKHGNIQEEYYFSSFKEEGLITKNKEIEIYIIVMTKAKMFYVLLGERCNSSLCLGNCSCL
jgi:hypothetical protein